MTQSFSHQLHAMRTLYEDRQTRSVSFRKEQLSRLKSAMLKYEVDLYDALYQDLKKSREESWITELGLVISELNFISRNLKNWMRPEAAATNLLNFPSTSYVIREPLGVVLIISPWNYPFMLLINPLLGAIAAGNCVVLKPSEFAPATAAVMKQIIAECFPPEYILFIEGDGSVVIPALMKNFRFDHVFYTGSATVGKIIYQMAAEQLVPVTLELGGKSPCIIDEDANVRIAARRITLTKFSNCGQMCVAPDYVLVHQSRKEELLANLAANIKVNYGQDPAANDFYGKIINEKQFDRINAYLKQGRIVYGGASNRDKLFIEPTVITDVPQSAPVLNEEIFGPVLPVIPFEDHEEALKILSKNPNPLSFYLFTSTRENEKKWLNSVSFGGGCINNTSWQFTNHHLPFGGRGSSGTGQYHGRHTFEAFCHRKAIMRTPTWFDPAIKYPPYKGRMRLFKWVMGHFR